MVMALVTSVLLYGLTIMYLKRRYPEDHGLERKRNLLFAAGYLIFGLAGGYLFTGYGFDVLAELKYLLIMDLLCVVAYVDYRERIIPNTWIIGILWLGLLFLIVRCITQPSEALPFVVHSLAGMVFAGGIFLAGRFFCRTGIGMGDVKLFGALGFYLGNYTVSGVLMVSLLIAAAAGLVQLCRKKLSLKGEIPFAPCIAIGSAIALLLGC